MKRHRTADLEPTSFGGRYTLLRRLAIGGMAEIYLARQAAAAGFEKEIVIKRLRAELADDPRIIEMFLDEARIGALLNHPNIVHVYDVDEHDGIPYIAMEYIVGEELNQLCRRGLAHEQFLPLEHAVELVRQAASGMGHFHSKRSISALGSGTLHTGQSLEIVHLDISPSNLMVTQDGFLKIIDFGIANARGQRQRSDVIPGKLGYMSPEQATRKPVDHRSDIFSLGIVLYEITVGKRLFRGPAREVVPKLVEAKVEPPTFARRTFPTALEAIVLRTLEKHPDDRYQSAYDLADDLEAFLRDERMHSGPVRIARYLDQLTQAGGGPRRPELLSEAERGDIPIASPGSAGARSTPEGSAESIASPGSAGARSTPEGSAESIASPGSAGARSTPEGSAESIALDFDSQVFDAFVPAAAAWEDAEQPEADVAAALGLELAELRALRTPVPTVPSGMAPVTGRVPRTSAEDAVPEGPLAAGDTEATARPKTDPGADDLEMPTLEQRAEDPAAKTMPMPPPSMPPPGVSMQPAEDPAGKTMPMPPPNMAVPTILPQPPGVPVQPPARPSSELRARLAPSVPPPVSARISAQMAAYVTPQAQLPERGLAQRLPWILVGALGVAVLALVAYIVWA